MSKRRGNRVALPAIGWFGILLGVFCLFLADLPVLSAQGPDPNLPRGAAYRGARLFSERCVQCHGPLGKGDGPMAAQVPVRMADFTDPAFAENRSPEAVFAVISNGRIENLMPPWKNTLSENDIWDVTAFVWSLHLGDMDLNAAALQYQNLCATCHGAQGEGNAQTPALAQARWLAATDAEWRTAASGPAHPALPPSDAEALRQAIIFGRSFSLGFNLTQARVEGNGRLSVRVRNETTGAILAGAVVDLLIFEGTTLIHQRRATADAEGVARFEGLPTETSWAFVATTVHNEIPFESGLLQFEPTQSSLEAALPVYEPGARQEDVRITRGHWVIGIEDMRTLNVGELYAFVNTSDRVYTGELDANGHRVVLALELPPNATNIGVEGDSEGTRFIRLGNRLVDTLPLPPGQRQVLLRYSLPVQDGAVELGHPIGYPVDNLNLLAPDIGIRIEASDWLRREPLKTPSGDYLNFVLTDLPAGSAPRARLSNIGAAQVMASQTTTAPQTIDPNAQPGLSGLPWVPLVLAVFAILLFGGGTFVLARRQQAQMALLPALREQQKRALIQAIAELDDRFEAGELTEAAYQTQRRLLKARLITLMRDEG
jgi:mono/diheme cytochrome c family protein